MLDDKLRRPHQALFLIIHMLAKFLNKKMKKELPMHDTNINSWEKEK